MTENGLADILIPGPRTHEPAGDLISRALRAIRFHLGMEVAYVSEMVGGQSVFRHVDAPGLEDIVAVGDARALDDVYCRHILEGRLPELMPDTADVPLAAGMPITAAVPIGAHISVPLIMPDGRRYGMFCCLSRHPHNSLNERDLGLMRAVGDLVAHEIHLANERDRVEAAARRRVESVLDGGVIGIVYQPIWSVESGRPVGAEALARFPTDVHVSPDLWFREAADLGLGVQLEMAAIEQAFALFHRLPPDIYLTLNASPETIMSPDLRAFLEGERLDRIVIEVTEHASVANYDDLVASTVELRRRGMRIAVDDAGAGYASLSHILSLQPEIIKLDTDLTRGVQNDHARQALTTALVDFGRRTGARIIAEGVETAGEYEMLRSLGVRHVQGHHIGRPVSGDAFLRLLDGHPPGAPDTSEG